MSLEQALVAAASAFLAAMNSAAQPPAQASAPAFVPPPAAPVTPAFVPPVAAAPAPAMPPTPTFAPPAPAAPVAAVPFSDQAGLIAWTTAAYHALGPKGEGIGQIMQSLGAGAISDIKPEQYGQFVAAVEALRG